MEQVFCARCGTTNVHSASFCTECGAPMMKERHHVVDGVVPPTPPTEPLLDPRASRSDSRDRRACDQLMWWCAKAWAVALFGA